MPWMLDFSVPASPTFYDANWNWIDGPWEDPPVGSSQTGNFGLAITANTGDTITLEYDGVHTIPEIRGIGQAIRLWTQPAAWSSAGSYSIGNSVTYNNVFYTTSENITGVVPGNIDPATGIYPWTIDETLGTWSNGFLVSKTSTTMTFQIVSAQQVPTYSPANIIETYQAAFFFTGFSGVGAAPAGTIFAGRGPSCACWHEGRIWLAGAGTDFTATYPASLGSPLQFGYNRFDSSEANGTVTVGGSIPTLSTSVPIVTVPQFSPTDTNGNPLDSSGISYTLNSDTAETHPLASAGHGRHPSRHQHVGVADHGLGPQRSDHADQHPGASPDDRFGSEHRRTDHARSRRHVRPAERASRRSSMWPTCCPSASPGRPLNERARHLSGTTRSSTALMHGAGAWVRGGIQEIALQRQPYPFVWAAMTDGSLASLSVPAAQPVRPRGSGPQRLVLARHSSQLHRNGRRR